MSKTMVELEGLELVRETENGVLMDYEGEEYWLPKSQIKMEIRHDGSFDCKIPEWLATEKGMI